MRRLLLLSLSLLLALPALAAAAPSEVGRVVEYRLAPGTHAQALVSGPDGDIWFAGLRYGEAGVTDVVGKVSPKGEVTEFPLGTHAADVGLADIALGPEGSLWFTEGGREKVGRITPEGRVLEFELPTAAASPQSIVAGPDGNLWFTEEGAAKVGRITPAGVVTEFPVALDGPRPHGIVAGPDNALWVTEPMSSTIARFATDGGETDYALAAEGLYPLQIVVGPDNALWFSQRGGAVGRIATDGSQASFPVPVDQTYALASGPSGVLWYSNGAGRIGSLGLDGSTAHPACIRSCGLPITALTEGPDGKLWFAAGTELGEARETPGTVGTFSPPPLESRIGAGSLRGRTVRIPIICDWGVAGSSCDGVLQLSGRLPRAGSAPGRPTTLAQRRFRLPLGGSRRIALRLPSRAVQFLKREGRLVLTASSKVAGGRRDARRIVLSRR
jgi:virginiamycin B lyase